MQKEKDEGREEEDEGSGAAGGEERLSQRRRSYGLKNFMTTMEGKQHRVVEMRIAVVCGFGVALRILFLDEVPEKTLMSTFVLVASTQLQFHVLTLSYLHGVNPQRVGRHS